MEENHNQILPEALRAAFKAVRGDDVAVDAGAADITPVSIAVAEELAKRELAQKTAAEVERRADLSKIKKKRWVIKKPSSMLGPAVSTGLAYSRPRLPFNTVGGIYWSSPKDLTDALLKKVEAQKEAEAAAEKTAAPAPPKPQI